MGFSANRAQNHGANFKHVGPSQCSGRNCLVGRRRGGKQRQRFGLVADPGQRVVAGRFAGRHAVHCVSFWENCRVASFGATFDHRGGRGGNWRHVCCFSGSIGARRGKRADASAWVGSGRQNPRLTPRTGAFKAVRSRNPRMRFFHFCAQKLRWRKRQPRRWTDAPQNDRDEQCARAGRHPPDRRPIRQRRSGLWAVWRPKLSKIPKRRLRDGRLFCRG